METMADYRGLYAAAYRDPSDVAWKMGKILLKYRPIAPKPATGGTLTSPPVRHGAKRKGRDRCGRRGRKRLNRSPAGTFSEENKNTASSSSSLVTLPLMPVTPQRKDEHVTSTPSPASSFEGKPRDGRVEPQRRLASTVTVECVTDTWHSWQMPFASHALLEHDACPGFVSGPGGGVTWTNSAYRKMVAGLGGGGEVDVDVELVTKGMVPENATCFTCGARVKYVHGDGGGKVNTVVPCDVWRLGDGKLAWRLDVKAALSLCL